MKRLFAFLVGLVTCASLCLAGPPDAIKWTGVSGLSNVVGTATANAPDQDKPVTRWVDHVIVDITTAYASPTVTVFIATEAGGGTGASRTILSKAVIADGTYPVRDNACGTTGTDITDSNVRIPLVRDKLDLKLYAANTNLAITADVYLVLTDEP